MMNKKAIAIAVLVGAAIAFRLFLWNPIMDWFKKKSDESKEDNSTTVVSGEGTQTGSPIEFSVWRVNDYKKLQSLGKTIKLSPHPEVIADKLRTSGVGFLGFNAAVDSEFLGAIKMCSYQTVVNQVVSVWASRTTFYNIGTDFLGFAKDCLSDENYSEMLDYVTNLPKGFK